MVNRESLIDVIMGILGMNNSIVLRNIKLLEALMLNVKDEKYKLFFDDYYKASKSIVTKLYNDPSRVEILSILLGKWLIPISRNVEFLKKDKISDYCLCLNETFTLYKEFIDELYYIYGYRFDETINNQKEKSVLKSLIRTLIK